jgi:ribosomal protein L11 methyltransferase
VTGAAWVAEATVPAAEAEAVAAEWWLAPAPPVAVVETPAPDGAVTLVAGYARRAEAEAAARLAGGSVSPAPAVEWAALREGWPAPEVAGRVLDLEPGPTFGWGGHPSTRLVLDRLPALVPARGAGTVAGTGATVLDVGSGSGVLGIAALLLGSGSVLAVDVDEDAVAATRRNAERNGVGAHLTARRGGPGAVDGRFDVVLANLTAPVHQAEAAAIARCCVDAGTLVASGMLAGRTEPVVEAYEAEGLAAVTSASLDGWTAVVLRRPSAVTRAAGSRRG